MPGKINQEERAMLAWDILTQVAKTANFIRYNELGNKIGIHHRAVRFVLERIQNYCLENKLPPLTILVVNQSGHPGQGFIACDVSGIDGDEGEHQVRQENWGNCKNPWGYSKGGLTESTLINALITNPDNSKKIYAKIKVRGMSQQIFRDALLKVYGSKCAFCGFSFAVALQASHIIPWSKANETERLDVRNGLLLCATHHKLFDWGLLRVGDDFSITVHYSKKSPRKKSDSHKFIMDDLINRKIILPKNENLWPKVEYLNQYRGQFETKSK